MFRFITSKPLWVNFLIAIVILALLLLLFLSSLNFFTQHGKVLKIPTVTGKKLVDAKKFLEDQGFEVIIQDLRLGTTKNPDGLTIIRLAHEFSPETRIVVLTAYGSHEVEAEAKASGADAFLRKPQPLSQVAQVVRGLIESPRRWAAPHV